jgi:NADH:ubiquinone oxidoreductase subunit 6 (subunit J)
MSAIALGTIIALTLGSAAVALCLRRLIRSVLLLVISWAGIAAFYLWAGAGFLAFAQVLVYIGAVSMVVLFAVLLTRRHDQPDLVIEPPARSRAAAGVTIGACVAAVLIPAILATEFPAAPATAPAFSVRQLGLDLMEQHGVSLLIVGLILTVALLGAVVLAASKEDAP